MRRPGPVTALVLYLTAVVVLNLAINLAINAGIALLVFCCTVESVPVWGDSPEWILQGLVDYAILTIFIETACTWFFNAPLSARDARLGWWGLPAFERPASWTSTPLRKMVADTFYANDVLHVKKDWCKGPDGVRPWKRTLNKWLVHTLKSLLFGLVVLLIFTPALILFAILDICGVVTWDTIGMIILQTCLGTGIGTFLAPVVVLMAMVRLDTKHNPNVWRLDRRYIPQLVENGGDKCNEVDESDWELQQRTTTPTTPTSLSSTPSSPKEDEGNKSPLPI